MTLRLIVGLGNPGEQYQHHRHNYGFRLLDRLCHERHLGWSRQAGSLVAQERVDLDNHQGNPKVWLLKPMTMMNRSGTAVGIHSRYYDIAPDEILVLYDELDLPVGKVRHRLGGGANGHKGVSDIINHIGAGFHRLRLGIDHPGDKNRVHQHVLGDFSRTEATLVDRVIDEVIGQYRLLIVGDFPRLMNHLARHIGDKAQ